MTTNVDSDLVLSRMPPRLVLADEVYSRLRTLIMESSILPDTRINIEDVARQLDVSPTPVRESLARLESDGLVDKLPLKGYRTTELLDRDAIRELYELRLLLEPNAAAQASAGMTSARADRLRAEVQSGSSQVQAHAGNDTSYQELSHHDVRLHDLVLELAGNETIRRAYARTHCHLHIFRLSYSGTFGTHTIDEHAAVVDAITSGDAAAAESAMSRHIVASRDRTLSHFDVGLAAGI